MAIDPSFLPTGQDTMADPKNSGESATSIGVSCLYYNTERRHFKTPPLVV